MQDSPNEFSHVIRLDEIGGTPIKRHITASEEECAALAKRFGLTGLDHLSADLTIVGEDAAVHMTGHFESGLSQPCIASGKPVPETVREEVNIYFTAEPDFAQEEDSELELEADDCDIIYHDGRGIDIGEAVAQSLSLAINPYPRAPDAEEILRAAGVKSEGESGPFGALSALKDKMLKGK